MAYEDITFAARIIPAAGRLYVAPPRVSIQHIRRALKVLRASTIVAAALSAALAIQMIVAIILAPPVVGISIIIAGAMALGAPLDFWIGVAMMTGAMTILGAACPVSAALIVANIAIMLGGLRCAKWYSWPIVIPFGHHIPDGAVVLCRCILASYILIIYNEKTNDEWILLMNNPVTHDEEPVDNVVSLAKRS